MFHVFSLVCFLLYGVNSRSGHDWIQSFGSIFHVSDPIFFPVLLGSPFIYTTLFRTQFLKKHSQEILNPMTYHDFNKQEIMRNEDGHRRHWIPIPNACCQVVMPARLEKFRIADRVECKTKTLKFERGGKRNAEGKFYKQSPGRNTPGRSAKNRLSKNRIWY